MTLQEIKLLLLHDWNVVRIIRIGMGGVFLYQAVASQDLFVGLLATFLLVQGIMNWSCCGVGSCASKQNKNTSSEDQKEVVSYEELN